MHKKLTAVAALAALTIAAFASGGTSARAGETLWQEPGPSVDEAAPVGGVVLAQYGCAGGSTDCPTDANRSPHRYGDYNHYRDGRRWHRRDWDRRGWDRRHWEPRHQRRYVRPHFGIEIVPEYRPRYRQVPRGGLSRAHVNWCYNRYRSYRAWDNTFQPYHGPRQQCWSPYS